MEPIRVQRTAAAPQGARPTLHTVQPRECGAAALFSPGAQELGRLALIKADIPPAPPGRRTSLSVGPALLLAALQRAPWPTSKRAVAEWYQGTVRARVGPAAAEALSRQRFWDHRDGVAEVHCAPRQEALLARRRAPVPVGERLLVYAPTPYDPCMHTCTRRPSRPPRGSPKQPRAAWRQRSLALVVDAAQGLPLSCRGSAGTPPAVVALGASLQGRLGPCGPQHASPPLTLRLDKGPGARDHFPALSKAHVACRAARPAGGVRQLSQGAVKGYQPRALPAGRRGKVSAQPQARLGGIAGKRLVRCRPRLYRQQGRTLAMLQRPAAQTLHTLHAPRQAAVARHRPRTAPALRREMSRARRHDRLQDWCSPTLRLHHGAVAALRWAWERRTKRALKPGTLGRTVLWTARRELSEQRIVRACRSQAKAAALCRIRQRRRPGLGWPASPWTARKPSVHALYGLLALLVMRLVLLRRHERHLALGVALLLERLRGRQAALVGYANGPAQRGLTQRSPEQAARFVARNVRPLAEQLGHTVLTLSTA